MGYRQVHTKMWKDPWFIELEQPHKLLFIYLFTNELASISGIYEISERVIQFETGLSRQDIRTGFTHFKETGKALYDDGVVWVFNLRKYHESKSPKVQAFIEKDIGGLKDCELKRLYCQSYNLQLEDGELPQLGAGVEVEDRAEQRFDSKVQLPFHLHHGELADLWHEWLCYHQEKGRPLTVSSALRQFKEFEKHTPDENMAALEHSIKNNYTGLYYPDKRQADGKPVGYDVIQEMLQEVDTDV